MCAEKVPQLGHGCVATIFTCDWKTHSCNRFVQGKSRTDGHRCEAPRLLRSHRWARPSKQSARFFFFFFQDLVSNTRCDGFQEQAKKRKRQDLRWWVGRGSALPHTPLSSIFCALTCCSFELCTLSGLSPHVQYDQFRPCRLFLFHFCRAESSASREQSSRGRRNKKNFDFQQRNKKDSHFGRKKDFQFSF